MSLRIVHPGVFTTIQDLGQPGRRGWGVPLGGAFDRASHSMANALVGNDAGCKTLEFTLFGGEMVSSVPLALGFAGGEMRMELPGYRDSGHASSFTLQPGEHLRVGSAKSGIRAYLAVAGGWLDVASRERRLEAGDVIAALRSAIPTRWVIEPRYPMTMLRIMDGPDAMGQEPIRWSELIWKVSPLSHRIGLRLEGTPIAGWADPNRVSTPVLPGSVQLAGGLPMILGVAGGTMGGYPHVAQVISADLDRLGQLGPGSEVRFEVVTLDMARRLDTERRRILAAQFLRIRAMAHDGLIML